MKFTLLIVIVLVTNSLAQTMSCKFSSFGSEFDLSPLAQLAGPSGFNYVDKDGVPERYYYWTYCQNIQTPPRQCAGKSSSALMTFVNYCNEYGNLAQNPTLDVIDNQDPSKGVVLTYTSSSYTCGGEGLVTFTVINLCDPSVDHAIDAVEGPPDVCDVTVSARSKYACPIGGGTNSKGLSLGSILLIIFFSSLFVYCFVGIIYNARKGQRGFAIIPNSDTWADLPVKVKDGCKWIVSKITGRNNYSEIKN